MSKGNSWPAFPEVRIKSGDNYNPPTRIYYNGMTLRDYFAAKAMPVVWNDIPDNVNREAALLNLGRCCYEMADAMLRAREAE